VISHPPAHGPVDPNAWVGWQLLMNVMPSQPQSGTEPLQALAG